LEQAPYQKHAKDTWLREQKNPHITSRRIHDRIRCLQQTQDGLGTDLANHK
jgi:hypothetical protein